MDKGEQGSRPEQTFRLSEEFTEGVVVDGAFSQTDFAQSALPRSACLASTAKYLSQANANRWITCVVTTPELAGGVRQGTGIVAVEEPAEAFFKVHNRLFLSGRMKAPLSAGFAPAAQIHPRAIVEDGCCIERDVVVDAGAIIKAGTILGESSYIGAGAIVGAEGHFYKHFHGRLFRIEHAGGVRVGPRSQILAGAIVQRSLYADFTEIGEETVLGPGVQIAHGVKIGDRSILAGGSEVAGYTRIGDEVWIGPSCAIGNLISVGNRARIEIGSVVVKSVPEGDRQSGMYAGPHIRMLRAQAKIFS